nr:DUF1549 domain-containing protein [Saprospiraceae bacterium]
WLDVARYADTVGFHGDQNQRIFPYRDYVIRAFNANKRFDQFTLEQLAGDLLPNATTEQRIASGFNRLNMMTREGGAQAMEYLIKYQADRVRTVGGAWLGATLGCAECHDHKFDPFLAKDFYSMSAYFADVKQFELKITESGNPCGDDFKLSMPYRDSLSYQWYRDGIAIIGATSASLEGIEDAPGAYQVRLVGPNSCMTTLKYIYKKPQYRTTIDSVICKDESVFFHQANINVAGEYFDTLQSFRGCDSILQLRLKISAEGVDTVVAKIFEGETYMLGNQPFKKAGEFDAHFSSLYGCDSVVHLSLDFYKIFIPNALTPNGDGINDVFTIYSGNEVEEVLSLEVFDRWGGQVFSQFSLPPNDGTYGWDGTAHGKPASLGTYVWQASVRFDDGKKRVLSGSVTLLQ